MRLITAIVTIIGVISSVQLFVLAQASQSYEKRHDTSIIGNHQRRSLEGHEQQLEKRLGIFAAAKGLFKVGKLIGTAIYNRKHHRRRSYDELLEERDKLFQLRDQLDDAHQYLAKRSDYDERSLSNDIVKRLIHQKRGVDYLLGLNERDMTERDVNASISDLN